MKNAAKRDIYCDLHLYVNHQDFERSMHLKVIPSDMPHWQVIPYDDTRCCPLVQSRFVVLSWSNDLSVKYGYRVHVPSCLSQCFVPRWNCVGLWCELVVRACLGMWRSLRMVQFLRGCLVDSFYWVNWKYWGCGSRSSKMERVILEVVVLVLALEIPKFLWDHTVKYVLLVVSIEWALDNTWLSWYELARCFGHGRIWSNLSHFCRNKLWLLWDNSEETPLMWDSNSNTQCQSR